MVGTLKAHRSDCMNVAASVSFSVEALPEPEASTYSVVPLINGTALIDMVAAFERDRHFEPAGGYGGLIPQFFDYGVLDRYFLGEFESGSYWAGLGCIYVLGCDCGEVGCWPLSCRVRVIADTVVWDQFRQPHRSERDYSQFGPFVFDAEQYSSAIKDLQTKCSQAVVDSGDERE
jgi:hypothetical protein